MQGLPLLVAATLALQQPVVPLHIVVPPVQAQAALGALHALDALDTLDALDALDALGTDEGWVQPDEQDPTDSLWRAARQALNRADYQSAANLYGDPARRYPTASRAGDALYWESFAFSSNTNLDRRRTILAPRQRRYPRPRRLRAVTPLPRGR